ncbi:hypothetical protein [Beijerinckia sp. L45]|uniref:hypothetical protein n=1 Tax=Beijerinckia sp. L45 TaxID=1641855 RepID=UPI00131C453C|nr:hypothetical protein [Beijerinckia sp. L45]
MIELSLKALRFARLVAEQQSAFADDQHVKDLRQDAVYQSSGSPAGSERPMRYVSISDDTALFCLKAIETFLQGHNFSASSDWDGNDLQYLEGIKGHLARSLALDAFDGGRPAP